MNRQECADVLQYVRQVVRTQGRADLDELLVGSRLVDVQGEDRQLFAYLEGLRDEIALGSEKATRQTMMRLRQIQTEDGGPVLGVVVDVTDADAAIYGTRRVDLVGSPEFDALVRQLDDLLAELREDADPQ